VSGDPTGRSALWVAQRVPDGHIAVVSNTFIIRKVDCKHSAEFLCSTDLERKVRATGEWNGRGTLDWVATIAPDLRTHSYVISGIDGGPVPYYVTARTWRVFSKLAPSLGLQLTDDILRYPFSVRPDQRLSHRNFMDLWRDHFEGTDIDLTVGALAGPFGSPYRMEAGIGLQLVNGQFARSMSLPRTSAIFVSQTFAAGGITKLWIGQDTPASTVLVPFYPKTMLCDDSYNIGNLSVYDDRSSWWVFDFVANWMGLNYRLMNVDVRGKIQELQDYVDHKNYLHEQAAQVRMDHGDVDGAIALLTRHQKEVQSYVVDAWRRFSHFLIMKFNDGYINDVKIGTTIGYPAWWLQMFHVDRDITPKWGQPSSRAPSYYEKLGPGPYETSPKELLPPGVQSLTASDRSITVGPTFLVLSVMVSLAFGFILGKRRSGGALENYHLMSNDGC
jgi:dipeptidase